jgi:hypothetical protein
MTNISTLDYLKSLCGDFNKIREDVIRESGEDQNEVDRRLTERILLDLIVRPKEEEDSWYVIEFNAYSLTQLQIYININYMLMLETS